MSLNGQSGTCEPSERTLWCVVPGLRRALAVATTVPILLVGCGPDYDGPLTCRVPAFDASADLRDWPTPEEAVRRSELLDVETAAKVIEENDTVTFINPERSQTVTVSKNVAGWSVTEARSCG